MRVGLAVRWLLILLLPTMSAACMHPPPTAVPPADAPAGGPITEATPLATVARQAGVQPLDPAAPRPLLEQLLAELRKTDPAGRYTGTTYDLTRGNALPADWVVQTPDFWGHRGEELGFFPLTCTDCEPDFRLPSCRSDADCGPNGRCGRLDAMTPLPYLAGRRLCLGQSDAVVDRFYDLLAGARSTVDITTLQPAPDDRFMAALRDGVTRLAQTGRPVTVRLLVGQYPPDGVDAHAVLAQLVRDARAVPGAHLAVYVAAMRSCTGTLPCDQFSWNHAKILAVDGRAALVGGHNQWSSDYLIDHPVHDLSMILQGPAAADAERFADALWDYVCSHPKDPAVSVLAFRSGDRDLGQGCLARLPPPEPAARVGTLPVLAVGRLGAGITRDFANQNDLARDLMLGAARRSIRIVQQDIGFRLPGALGILDGGSITWPETTLDRLADLLRRGGDVYIVLSNLGSEGRSKSSYSNGVPLAAVARRIADAVTRRGGPTGDAATELLCRHLHLAPFRFGPEPTWPGDEKIANHGKFWMVDDRAFYIGSDNLYPVDLQEFGYILDDAPAAATLRRLYWDPLWHWSSRAAISGGDARRCVFRADP
jgi:phosphatidylserine/phosphatidylglycerophosphate/cardiolipin synthase-like enzyme